MLLLPVLDLKAGIVVRGVAGRRAEYRPIQSRLTSAIDPPSVARAYRDSFGLTTLYLADLDAIAGAEPAYATYAALAREGFSLWVDAGLRKAELVPRLRDHGVSIVIAGLETAPGPELFEELAPQADGILVSLDMKDGRALTPFGPWQSMPISDIARQIGTLGFRRFLLLDLERVGMGQGTGTEAQFKLLAGGERDLFTGGGVRGAEDLRQARALGAAGVLVASALHEGNLTREEINAECGLNHRA